MKNSKKKIFLSASILSAAAFIGLSTVSCKYTITATTENELSKIELSKDVGIYSTANQLTASKIVEKVKRIENNKTIIDQDLLFSYVKQPTLHGNVKMVVVDVVALGELVDASSNVFKSYLEISYYLQKGSYKTDIKTFNAKGTDQNDFRSDAVQDQIDVNTAASEFDKPLYTFSINNEGSKQLASSINLNNIAKYVNGITKDMIEPEFELFDKKAKLKIDKIVADNDPNNQITISFQFLKNDAKSKTIEKKVTGFKTPEAKDQSDVDELVNKNLDLIAKKEAAEILPSAINADNFDKYIEIKINDQVVDSLNSSEFNGATLKLVYLNANDENGLLTIDVQYVKNGAVSKILRKQDIGGFKSRLQKDQEDVENQANIEFNLSVFDKANSHLPSEVDMDNLKSFVTGFPNPDNGVKLNIVSIVPDNAKGELKISLNFTKGNAISHLITKNVQGFRTQHQQDEIDVQEEKNKIKFSPTEKASSILASEVVITDDKYKEYINIDSLNNLGKGVQGAIVNVSGNDKLGTVTVTVSVYKNSARIEIKEIVQGFRTTLDQDLLDVNEEYSKYKDVNLTITNEGKNKLASEVNADNIKSFVGNLPTPTKANLKITQVIPKSDDNTVLLVSFQFYKRDAVSLLITKEVSGFKSPAQDDVNKVDELINEFKPALLSEGAKVNASNVTTDNVRTYVTGIPENKNGVEVNILNVSPKSDNLDNDTILIKVEFRKNGASRTVTKEVSGFRIPTEQEKLEIEINKINLRVTEEGKKITAFSVKNVEKFKKYVEGWEKYDSLIQWQSSQFSVVDKKSETDLKADLIFVKNNFQIKKTFIIQGFLTVDQETNNIMLLAFNKYKTITVKDRNYLNKYNTSFFYNKDLTELKKYFTFDQVEQAITQETKIEKSDLFRNIEREFSVEYSKTNPNLNLTTLSLNWKLKNKLTKEVFSSSAMISGFLDPYLDVRQIDKTMQTIPATWYEREQATPEKFIIAGTWQTTWPAYGWTNEMKAFAYGKSDWEKWSNSWFTWKMNQLFGSKYSMKIDRNFNLKKYKYTKQDVGSEKNMWTVNCLNEFDATFTRADYYNGSSGSSVSVKITLQTLLKNNYWKYNGGGDWQTP